MQFEGAKNQQDFSVQTITVICLQHPLNIKLYSRKRHYLLTMSTIQHLPSTPVRM